MKIDNALLTKLETLCTLKIQDDKREEIIKQLSEVVNFVENLNELDLDDEEITFTTVKGGTPMREDEPYSDEEVINMILENAPQKDGRFFAVPTIIE